jgi:hypothetical protein
VCRGPCGAFSSATNAKPHPNRGWGGIRNGNLLDLAESEFSLFITSDQGLKYQQNLAGRRIAILVLSTNKLRPILRAANLILTTVSEMRPGEVRLLDIPLEPKS